MARQKVSALEKSLREQQLSKMESDRARQDLELQLQRERDKTGNSKTVEELKVLIATLQTQTTTLQQHVALGKVRAPVVLTLTPTTQCGAPGI